MKKNILIGFLSIIILILGGYLVYDKVISQDNNSPTTNTKKDTNKYKSYSIRDEVTLKDGSKWHVISDSDSNTEYVTIVSTKDYASEEMGEEKFFEFSNAFFDTTNKDFNTSKMKKVLENRILNTLDFDIKETDGYKIRLITIEELQEMYPGWVYKPDVDYYEYTGSTNLSNEGIFHILTMSPTICEGKCLPFYIANENGASTWSPGVGGIRPVINVNKGDINN